MHALAHGSGPELRLEGFDLLLLPTSSYDDAVAFGYRPESVCLERTSTSLVTALAGVLRLDVLVENRIVCELKSVDAIAPVFLAQILTQLKLADLHLGFLINFNVGRIKDGIRRVIR